MTTPSLYAVERYDEPGLTPPQFPDLPHPLRLTGAVYLPADEVVIAFVEGEDEQSVASTMRALGWRVDRISPASWLVGRTVG